MRIRASSLPVVVIGLLALCAISCRWNARHVSLASLPYLQSETYKERKAYRVDPFIQAAQRLQAMGQPAACEELLRLSRSDDYDDCQKLVVLCRMLFAKQPGWDFRSAMIGGPCYIAGTDHSDWPLEPIEIIDGIPFDIIWGYTLHGQAEPAQEYIRYCMTNCVWSDIRFEVKAEQQKKAALAKLVASPKWRRPLEQQDRDFFVGQIE